MAWVLLATVGLSAGMVNTIAGGGSLITLPALIFFGLSPTEANGTNRVGILFQSVVATLQMRKDGAVPTDMLVRVLPPVLLGAAGGVTVALYIDDDLMRRVIGGLMLLMVPVILARPKRWLVAITDAEPIEKLGFSGWAAFLGVGFYAGFIQAGVGVFFLASMVLLGGLDLVRGNGVKVAAIAVLTVPVLAAFIVWDLVIWAPGLVLASGAAVGGWIGANLTVAWGPSFVRWVLIAVVVVSGARLLFS